MKINLNIYPKKNFIKKIIIITIFMFLCFFIKENVFAESNIIPSRLAEFNNISTSGAHISEALQNKPNTTLGQWFADLSNPDCYIVIFDTTSQHDNYERIDIYFFQDQVTADFHHYEDFRPNKYWLYLNTQKNAYHKITITRPYSDSSRRIDIDYIFTDQGTPLSTYADETSVDVVYTNFDLYDENHNLLHTSDVTNFSLVSIPSNTGIGLKPKRNESINTYFSYGSDVTNLYGVWYNIDTKKYDKADFKIFDPLDPVNQGTATVEVSYNSNHFQHYIMMIGNRGDETIDLYYISNDFDLILYDDFYSLGHDSNGNIYYNPFEELNKRYDNLSESIFDVIANIPKSIGNFFNSILTGIRDLFIPNSNMLMDTLESEYDDMHERLGFLMFPIDIITNFANRFNNISNTPTSAIISIPNVSFMNVTLIHSTTFNLYDVVNSNSSFTYLYQLYRIVVSGLIVIFIGRLAYQKFNETIGGSYK